MKMDSPRELMERSMHERRGLEPPDDPPCPRCGGIGHYYAGLPRTRVACPDCDGEGTEQEES